MPNKQLTISSILLSFILITTNNFAQADTVNHHHNSAEENPSEVKTEHSHSQLEIPAGEAIPTVDLIVQKDPIDGWNLHIKTTNFIFAPAKVNQAGNYNEGHAHLYINGKKQSRIYGNWHHLPDLEPGEYTIKVSLNSNTHQTLTYQGKEIADSETILVK